MYRRERKTTLAQNSRPTNVDNLNIKTAAPARKMGKPKTPEEERAAAARREAIMKAFSQSAAPKVAPRLSDVSTSSSTRSSNAIDQMLSGMDAGTTRKRDTSLAPWAGTEYVGTVKRLRRGSLTNLFAATRIEIRLGRQETWQRKSLGN